MSIEMRIIGKLKPNFSGDNFPTAKECLSVFFYNIRVKKLTKSKAAALVADSCLEIWTKRNFITMRKNSAATKLLNLYAKWQNVMKNFNASNYKKKADAFEKELNKIFNVERKFQQKADDTPEEPALITSKSKRSHLPQLDPLA